MEKISRITDNTNPSIKSVRTFPQKKTCKKFIDFEMGTDKTIHQKLVETEYPPILTDFRQIILFGGKQFKIRNPPIFNRYLFFIFMNIYLYKYRY